MNREQKAATIDALAADIQAAEAIFAVDYRGISVAQLAELRAKLREGDATFKVVKNSLTERAADQVDAPALKEYLAGPTALTFVRGDVALAAKAVADYAKATQLLPFKGGVMGGETLDAGQIRSISKLPSREVLYGQLVGVVASPISGVVRTLNALISGLAVALGQVNEKKSSGELPAGDPPAAAAPVAEAEPASDEAPADEAPTEEAPEAAAEATSTEEEPAAAEAEPAAEAAAEDTTPDQAEPDSEPAQDDNQTEASADEQPETAEATKED
jgi:large subunit ribosomal protein L10